MSKKIVIVGAGLVGSILALSLRQKGHQVSLYEKRPDMRKTNLDVGRSINLVITAKGIRTLREAGLFEELEQLTSPVLGRMIHPLGAQTTFQPYGRSDTEYNYSISREALNSFLLDKIQAAGIKIYFEQELCNIDFDHKTIDFTDMKNISYDILFGADGAGSYTRRAMKKLLGELMTDSVSSLGVQYKELFMPATANGNYAIDAKSLHIWPRGQHMLMALPNQDGSFTMTLFVPDSMVAKIKTVDEIKAYFSEYYDDAFKLMPDYIEQFQKNPWGFLGTARCSPWVYQDSVCLVGDAAHAMVPFFGQGMNTGFSDIQFILDGIERHHGNWQLIFAEYNEFQQANGNAIQDMSIENYREMSEKLADQKFLLRKEVEHLLENRYPDKFRSKYGMVTYTLIPYQYVQAAGAIQAEILDELCEGINSVGDIDLEKALHLIEDKLLPFMQKHQLNIVRY